MEISDVMSLYPASVQRPSVILMSASKHQAECSTSADLMTSQWCRSAGFETHIQMTRLD